MANPFSKLKPQWHWLQFSLRTGLLLVALLCVALSRWVALAERQRRAVAAIRNFELRDRYGYIFSGWVEYARPGWAANEAFPMSLLGRRLPHDFYDEVQVVGLSDTQVTDAELTHLRGLTSLQKLELSNTQVTDAGLIHLRGLTNLQWLNLSDTQVTDAGLAHLRGLRDLRGLFLSDTQVTDAGLAYLRELRNLQRLSLADTHVTDGGLAQLRGLRNLAMLSLSNTQITDAALADLRGRTALRALYLDGSQITEAGRAELREAFPNLMLVGPGPFLVDGNLLRSPR